MLNGTKNNFNQIISLYLLLFDDDDDDDNFSFLLSLLIMIVEFFLTKAVGR